MSSRQNLGYKANAVATFEVRRPNSRPQTIRHPCRVTHNKLFTMTRAFCRETLRQLSGIDGETPYKLLSYDIIT